jgi:glycosyltransferase involved in cell wall biosynthesis
LVAIKNKYNLPDNFILFVGTIQPRKNVSNLIKAYHLLLNSNLLNGHKLVICGRLGWMYEDMFKNIKKLNLEKHIIFLNFIADKDLPYIYNLSDLFVFPSIYEGFGLPVLESMACGVPVITSNKSSLPEVAGNACVKVDPYKVRDIAIAISEILKDEKVSKKMIDEGLNQAKKFSWEKCASDTLRVYKELIKN